MLPDPDDVMISSAELLKNGPLVVTFYRGIWCPYCRQDLKHLGNAAPDIRSCGASLVAIAHQTVPDSNGKFQREHSLEFPILDDRQGDTENHVDIVALDQLLCLGLGAGRVAAGVGDDQLRGAAGKLIAAVFRKSLVPCSIRMPPCASGPVLTVSNPILIGLACAIAGSGRFATSAAAAVPPRSLRRSTLSVIASSAVHLQSPHRPSGERD
jgi:peroxiredoxin